MSLILDALKRLDLQRSIRPGRIGKIPVEILKSDLPLRGKEALKHVGSFENAFPHICAMITAHLDLCELLGEIVKECLFCLRAHRATIFMMDDRRESLREHPKLIHSLDPHRQEVYRQEEEAIARESFEQNKPFVLEKKDIYARFPDREPNWKFTSIMTFPFASRNEPVGILSAILFNGRHSFDGKRLQQFSCFARLASMAVEMDDLFQEVQRGAIWRRDFENYLDNILFTASDR
jgi:transcriptional regulator with GAF, ATPase, and Fis domain